MFVLAGLFSSAAPMTVIAAGTVDLNVDVQPLAPRLIITSIMQYKYAQKLFEKQDYETAIVEFKRFIHFFPQDIQKQQAQFNIAVSLFNLKKYHDAARAFNEIILKDQEDNITKQSIFFQSKSFLNMGNTAYAQIVLQNYLTLIKNTDDTDTKDQIYFNIAKIYLLKAGDSKQGAGALAAARKYLLKISQSNAAKYKADQHLSLIFKAEHVHKKSPLAAGLFAVIPGGGFLYCERYHDAFITFLLNAGLIAAAFEAWNNDNKALAGVIGFVETGFYTGNIYGSLSAAHKYNYARKNRILNMEIFGKDVTIAPSFDFENRGYSLSLSFDLPD